MAGMSRKGTAPGAGAVLAVCWGLPCASWRLLPLLREVMLPDVDPHYRAAGLHGWRPA